MRRVPRPFLIAAVFVGACGASSPKPVANDQPANAAAGECSQIAGTAAKSMRAKPNAPAGKLEAEIAKRCVDDEWNTALRRCMSTATSDADRGKCTDRHLTRDQQEKLTAAVGPYVESLLEEAMTAMRGFADRMCACKDAQCAQQVSEEMQKWGQEISKRENELRAMSEADQQRASELGEKMGKCMQTVMTPPPQPLKVSSIDPASGDPKGGTQVKIVGTGFTGDGRTAKVYFGTKEGKAVKITSDTEITVEAPAGKAKDVVDVRVVFEPGGEQKLPKAYTFAKKK